MQSTKDLDDVIKVLENKTSVKIEIVPDDNDNSKVIDVSLDKKTCLCNYIKLCDNMYWYFSKINEYTKNLQKVHETNSCLIGYSYAEEFEEDHFEICRKYNNSINKYKKEFEYTKEKLVLFAKKLNYSQETLNADINTVEKFVGANEEIRNKVNKLKTLVRRKKHSLTVKEIIDVIKVLKTHLANLRREYSNKSPCFYQFKKTDNLITNFIKILEHTKIKV